jgi:hypothetical protein
MRGSKAETNGPTVPNLDLVQEVLDMVVTSSTKLFCHCCFPAGMVENFLKSHTGQMW